MRENIPLIASSSNHLDHPFNVSRSVPKRSLRNHRVTEMIVPAIRAMMTPLNVPAIIKQSEMVTNMSIYTSNANIRLIRANLNMRISTPSAVKQARMSISNIIRS